MKMEFVMENKAYILGGLRSYIGVENGMYKHIPAEILGAEVLKKVVEKYDIKKPDYIIVDPPREGLQPKALTKILSYQVPSVIYIACKPQSLARDIPAFLNAGYSVKHLSCVDMFPRTANIETIALFTRN